MTNLSQLALHTQTDRATSRRAWILAVIFHAVLLAVQLPETGHTEPPPPAKRITAYVVPEVRFKPPRPRPAAELPRKGLCGLGTIPSPNANDAEGPVRVGGAVQPPVKLHAPAPRYPESARSACIEGVVIIQVLLNEKGDVVDATILKGLPFGLDQAALQTVRTWKLEPATLHGKPVDAYFNLVVTFTRP